MFKNFFKTEESKPKVNTNTKTKRLANSLLSESGDFLLERQKHKLLDIKTSLSINDSMYDKLYGEMFVNFARLAQSVSASDNQHHSHKYGFIDHCFECVVVALRQREGFVYRSDQEDMIMQKKDVFTFAVVVAALCHDLGKLVTDIEYYNADSDDIHNIIYGPMPTGTEYIYRFYPSRKIEDHKSAGLILLTQVVTREGMNWLLKESLLYREVIHCLSGNYVEANKLGSIVVNADRHSTSSNLKSVSDKYSQTTVISNSLYDGMDNQTVNKTVSNININSRAVAIVDALKICLDNPEMYSGGKGLNVKGTFAWVTKEFIYVVHPRCHTLIDSVLSANGSKIKLTQPIICYAILKDAGFIDQVNNQHYTYYSINDENSWSVKLPLLRFFRSKIDPEHKYFETKMTIELPGEENKQGEVVAGEIESEPNTINAHSFVDSITSPQEAEITVLDKQLSQTPPLDSYNDEEITDTQEISPEIINPTELKDTNNSVQSRPKNKDAIFDEFINFLSRSFRLKSFDINKKGAPIHFVGGCMMLVSPVIFNEFIKDVGKEKIINLLGCEPTDFNKKLMMHCQNDIFSKNHHYKDISLKNILSFQAVGERKKSKSISGILFKPDFISLITTEKFSDTRNMILTSIVDFA